MKRVCVVCEGATEVEFVKSCLTPHLTAFDVYAYPSILRAPSGRHRGGRVTVDRLARFISHEYHAADRITTLVDFYGFQDAAGRSCAELESCIMEGIIGYEATIDTRFVKPYVQMYEFEGLLFSDVECFEYVLDGWDADVRKALTAMRAQFPCPEDINDSPETAPSKRILATFPSGTYSKTEHGPLIASEIGLATIRAQCPRFHQWMSHLEAWGA